MASSMDTAGFWKEANEVFRKYRGFGSAQLDGDDQHDNISDFLTAMDSLASTWYNRDDPKAGRNIYEVYDGEYFCQSCQTWKPLSVRTSRGCCRGCSARGE